MAKNHIETSITYENSHVEIEVRKPVKIIDNEGREVIHIWFDDGTIDTRIYLNLKQAEVLRDLLIKEL